VPAKSAPAYEHQLQQNATILGSNTDVLSVGLAFPGAVVLGVIVDKHGPPWNISGAIFPPLLNFLLHHLSESLFEENRILV
jgi:hypothetical protein